MVYKIGNIADLTKLPSLTEVEYRNLYEWVSNLDLHYGSDRNVDTDDGGYVLFATPGTKAEEIKVYFDYSNNTLEYVNTDCGLCSALYLLNNDYSVVIVMRIADAPTEITTAFEEGY